MPDVRVPGPHGEVPAYLTTPAAEPAAAERAWPGVVVVHEAFGLTPDIRDITDRLARDGFLTLAPDLLAWGPSFRCLMAAFRALSSGAGRAFDDLEAARSWLLQRPDCTGRVGVIGFCLGGGFALLLAPRGYAVSSVNYGMVPKDAVATLQGSCPVVASYGARDRMSRSMPQRLEHALTELGVEHDIEVYPGAGHSFLNRDTGLVALAFGTLAGAGYHEPSAEQAWPRILGFLHRHLDTVAQQDGGAVG